VSTCPTGWPQVDAETQVGPWSYCSLKSKKHLCWLCCLIQALKQSMKGSCRNPLFQPVNGGIERPGHFPRAQQLTKPLSQPAQLAFKAHSADEESEIKGGRATQLGWIRTVSPEARAPGSGWEKSKRYPDPLY
jgi:hypothetical protein